MTDRHARQATILFSMNLACAPDLKRPLNRILFYDAAGQRFAQTRLSEGPDPRQIPRTG
jgi:hypothetical protein